jgi:hypothetical protein
LLASKIFDLGAFFPIRFFPLAERELFLKTFQLRVLLPYYIHQSQHFLFFLVFQLRKYIEIELIVLFLQFYLKLVGLIYLAPLQKGLHLLVGLFKVGKLLKLFLLFSFFLLRGRELELVLNTDAEFIPACVWGELVAAWLELAFGLVDVAIGEFGLFDLVDLVPGRCAAHFRKSYFYNFDDSQSSH